MALLLPLPLVLVIGSVLRDRQGWASTPSGEARPVPVLSHEERLSRLTYQRACGKPEDCDPKGLDVCAPGYYCTRRTKRGPHLCEPDYWPKL